MNILNTPLNCSPENVEKWLNINSDRLLLCNPNESTLIKNTRFNTNQKIAILYEIQEDLLLNLSALISANQELDCNWAFYFKKSCSLNMSLQFLLKSDSQLTQNIQIFMSHHDNIKVTQNIKVYKQGKAKINITPWLHIHHDKLSCTHAISVSPVIIDPLFGLRGLNHDISLKLWEESFCN